MFKVQNSLTYRSWQVESRDELLSELEHLNARRNTLDPEENWDIFYLSEQGELLEKTSITFPFQATIDELLADFGFAKPKGRRSFFSRIFGRKKAVAPSEVITEPVQKEVDAEAKEIQQDLESVLEETALPQSLQEPEHEDIMEAETEQVEEEVRNLFHEQSGAEEEKVPDVGQPGSTEIEESSDNELLDDDSIFAHVAQSEIKETEESENLDTSVEESVQPSLIANEPEPIMMKVTGVTDVESLSVSRLQSDMEVALSNEIAQMDALIERLQEQRRGHVQLLEHLQQFKLN